MLRKDVEELEVRITEAERLLRLADPDGYYREGTHAAEAAKARGAKALAVERARREAAEQQRRARMVQICSVSAVLHKSVHAGENSAYDGMLHVPRMRWFWAAARATS